MLIDERFDMALDIEQLFPHDLRPKGAAKNDEDEGELTAARQLRRVKHTYGWLQVVVAEGLYPNGPFLMVVKQLELWDCRGIKTLSTYDGALRVVRAQVTSPANHQPTVPTPTRRGFPGTNTSAAVSHTTGPWPFCARQERSGCRAQCLRFASRAVWNTWVRCEWAC